MRGGEKARGVVGGVPVEVQPGTYLLKLLLPEPLEIRVTIKPDAKSVLLYDTEGNKITVLK